MMPYVETGWLCLTILFCIWVHLISSFFFFRRNLETLESHLNKIKFISENREFYGNSFRGREMRKIFIILVIVMPGIFKKQEIIKKHTIKKLPAHLENTVKIFFVTMNIIVLSMITLYYFRL